MHSGKPLSTPHPSVALCLAAGWLNNDLGSFQELPSSLAGNGCRWGPLSHELITTQGKQTNNINTNCYSDLFMLLFVCSWLYSRITYLVFVGGVKGNLSNFLVLVSHRPDRAARQLNTFQQSRLRSVTCNVSLQDGYWILSCFELRPVT